MSIVLTERAAEEVKSIINQNELPEATTLRIGVRGGGCSGFSYALDLVESADETDEKFEAHGVTVACDPKSALYLNGTTLDFKDDGMMQKGFVFNNPNATGTCGCGSSFSA
jgi:iron-sulfur cluster assembly protein